MSTPRIVRQAAHQAIGPGIDTITLANDAGNVLLAWGRGRGSTPGPPGIFDSAGNTWAAIFTENNAGFWICSSCKQSDSNEVTFDYNDYNLDFYVVEVAGAVSETITVGHDTSGIVDVSYGAYNFHLVYGGPFLWAVVLVAFHGSGAEPQDLVLALGAAEGGFDVHHLNPGWMNRFPSQSLAWSALFEAIPVAPTTCVPVGDIVTDLCRRAGVDPSLVDVSGLAGLSCCGFVITRPAPAVNLLRILMQAFFFDACESEGMLKFVPRGLPAALTIPEKDIGLAGDKGKIEETIGDEQSLPRDVTVTYVDPAKDYQQGKQMKSRNSRIVTTKNQDNLEIPITMSADFARQVAEKSLYLRWLEKNSYVLKLWKAAYLLLDPTDVLAFVYKSLTFAIRAAEVHFGAGFATQINGISHNDQNYQSAAVGGVGTGFVPQPIPVGPATILFLFDIPLLRDSDSNPGGTGFSFAMGSGSPGWKGASLLRSSDDASFASIDDSADAVTFGYSTNQLGVPAAPWVLDSTNTLNVKLTTGTLKSVTDTEIAGGANAFLIGNKTGGFELIQAKTATLEMDGSYTLSDLYRGLRGTEWAAGFWGDFLTGSNPHAIGDLFVDVYTGLKRHPDNLALLNSLRYYRAVSAGQDITGAPSSKLTNTGNDIKPYAPKNVGGSLDGAGNWQITWTRRSRFGGGDGSTGSPLPLGEDKELYDLEILNGSTVVRTISGLTTPTAIYTVAMQTSDFGSPPSSFHVNVYQISGQAGRGFKGHGDVPGGSSPVSLPNPGFGFYINGA